MPETTIKDDARRLVERLPEDATWEDLQYRSISDRRSRRAQGSRKGARWRSKRLGAGSGLTGHECPLDRGRAGRPASRGGVHRPSFGAVRPRDGRANLRSERTPSLQPRLGPVVPEYEDETLRELFVDPYRIVYRLLDDQVDIVAVVHGARRMPRGL